jgi:hypothetical protein
MQSRTVWYVSAGVFVLAVGRITEFGVAMEAPAALVARSARADGFLSAVLAGVLGDAVYDKLFGGSSAQAHDLPPPNRLPWDLSPGSPAGPSNPFGSLDRPSPATPSNPFGRVLKAPGSSQP